ncbi:sensor domain-containing diguanylate cyclase [Treponema zioleckii]|uniref:sensor domain-containing diguanylate cyclase n=1 Tax=Treponema zioleckii TaxID=331680 RepID=UPI00168AA9BD|nr:diguanylate cyclase [Treponema zioleckii]
MRQITCAIVDSYDAVKFLDEAKECVDYKNAKTVLVNIFTKRVQKDYISYISSLIKSKLPKAKISGLTCLEGFALGENFKGSTIITFLCFKSSDIEVLEYDFSKISIEEAKSSFLSSIKKYPELKGIQVYMTPLANAVTNDFMPLDDFDKKDIPIFGAGAAFGSREDDKKIYVFGNGIYEDGIVITLFSGEKLGIYAESTLGWTPIGKEMVVTDVENNNVLKTIDNISASEIYKKYLGVNSAKFFLENTCEFPFMLRRGDKWVARVPIQKDEDGNIHFTADIQKGEKLLFSYGSKNIILKQAFNLADYMSRKNLEGLLLHVCRTRRLYLKDTEHLELQAFSNFYRETAGCYAFSELLYKNKSGGLQNSALVAVGFREFENAEEKIYSDDCYVENVFYGTSNYNDFNKWVAELTQNKKDNQLLPFEERLVNFLHATTRDLYLANIKLEEAATIDGLTKIFNRKKISERISYELKKRDSKNIHLIMFDIDNFKHINDTYGHDMGDEVLVKIAQTAKQCIRKQDSIGRWGGEEFMILLPESAEEVAVAVAERIRTEIYSLKWEKMNQISISLGVAGIEENDDIQSFYKRVDNRLYFAKTHGKNRVIFKDE